MKVTVLVTALAFLATSVHAGYQITLAPTGGTQVCNLSMKDGVEDVLNEKFEGAVCRARESLVTQADFCDVVHVHSRRPW